MQKITQFQRRILAQLKKSTSGLAAPKNPRDKINQKRAKSRNRVTRFKKNNLLYGQEILFQ
ncbi:MAG: hypothetical protein NPINA01_23780 [Nitrospinaceae bacterium]|nr:MAG: hypothetical protein NPINA01_23780 [Nitrospinaceae bacterium]